MIRIITDSAADLEPQEAGRTGVSVVPMTVSFEDGTTITDDGSLTRDEFFARLAGEAKLPRTSQPSPEAFMRELAHVRERGDEAVVITISQKLSGTWQCASLAAQEIGGSVHLVDSASATRGQAILVREALRLRDEGASAAQIAAALEELKHRVRIVAVVDSLKHLHKGGRLPAAVALVGGALGLKPVLALRDDGVIRLVDKARGRPGSLVAMYKQLDKLGGIDPAYGCTVLYSDDRLLAAPVRHYLQESLHLPVLGTAQIGPTIGTHIGPRAVGVAFVAKETT